MKEKTEIELINEMFAGCVPEKRDSKDGKSVGEDRIEIDCFEQEGRQVMVCGRQKNGYRVSYIMPLYCAIFLWKRGEAYSTYEHPALGQVEVKWQLWKR